MLSVVCQALIHRGWIRSSCRLCKGLLGGYPRSSLSTATNSTQICPTLEGPGLMSPKALIFRCSSEALFQRYDTTTRLHWGRWHVVPRPSRGAPGAWVLFLNLSDGWKRSSHWLCTHHTDGFPKASWRPKMVHGPWRDFSCFTSYFLICHLLSICISEGLPLGSQFYSVGLRVCLYSSIDFNDFIVFKVGGREFVHLFFLRIILAIK